MFTNGISLRSPMREDLLLASQAILSPNAVKLRTDPFHCAFETIEVAFAPLDGADQICLSQMSRRHMLFLGDLSDLLHVHDVLLPEAIKRFPSWPPIRDLEAKRPHP